MSNREFDLSDLKRILREAAGEGEGMGLDGDILDLGFEELGYDSLALLESGSRIQREFGITLEDSVIADAPTPRALIGCVNEQLAAVSAA